ncbi:hypothetical protein [Mammaliicoccus vitulinus]|uniref:hypothetical protein n=1 Tax=Mammaliicoccus vitulinus TaxID=71237 RepID=UPI00248BB68E|nr:hypothetical protein [Mammaliicoccus vitulinus]
MNKYFAKLEGIGCATEFVGFRTKKELLEFINEDMGDEKMSLAELNDQLNMNFDNMNKWYFTSRQKLCWDLITSGTN